MKRGGLNERTGGGREGERGGKKEEQGGAKEEEEGVVGGGGVWMLSCLSGLAEEAPLLPLQRALTGLFSTISALFS